MKKTAAYYIDSVVSKLLAFVPGVVIARYFTLNLWDIFGFAAVFSFCVSGVYMILISKTFKQKPDKRAEEIRRQFLYNDDRFALEFFYEAFKGKCTPARKRKFIGVNGTALYCRFLPGELSADELKAMYVYAKKQNYDRLLVLTNTPSAAALKLKDSLPDMRADIFGFDRVNELMKWLDAAPEITKPLPEKKSPFARLAAIALDPKRFSAYLFSGLLLLVFSQFFTLSVYYIVFGSVLVTAGAALRIYGAVRSRRKRKDSGGA
ncbi:MAG: hypothetical protein LBH24_02085 [Clostridiales bacterium]|jgi:hypothetical protein|nr:hypothetical protein [Clostridiales bacterium]